MPFCYCFRSFISEMVSNQRSKTTTKEEAKWVAIGGEEEKRDFEKEVDKKLKTF